MDAQVLAHYGDAIRPSLRPLPDADLQQLRAVVDRRRQLLDMMSAEQNRLSTSPVRIRDAITHHLTWLRHQVASHLDPEQHTTSKRFTQKIERKHLTLRTRIKRLTRKTICFSKSTQMHDIVIGLFVNRYAFGRAV